MKIFIVEDSEIIKHRIFRLLASIDDVEIAGSSDDIDEAMIYIKNLPPDVILLDISVGKNSGLKMLQEIKKLTPKPKIIMFTNFDFESYKEKSFEYGADYYIDKSKEFEKLPVVIEELKKKSNFSKMINVSLAEIGY